MNKYRGYRYFLDKDGLWKIILTTGHVFIVALDDSKLFGNKRIVYEKNTEKTCKEYIDIITTN